jgi:hypothetical protein
MNATAQREAPCLGIFWVVQMPEAEPRLLAAGCPLDQAEPYGDWTCLEKVERHLLSLTPVFRTGLG